MNFMPECIWCLRCGSHGKQKYGHTKIADKQVVKIEITMVHAN